MQKHDCLYICSLKQVSVMNLILQQSWGGGGKSTDFDVFNIVFLFFSLYHCFYLLHDTNRKKNKKYFVSPHGSMKDTASFNVYALGTDSYFF